MTERFKGSWEAFFDIELPDNIINVRADYSNGFLKYKECAFDINSLFSMRLIIKMLGIEK